MNYKKLGLLLILVVLKISSQSEDKKNSFTVGANYQTDMQYMGRKDSINTPLFVPNFNYSFKNGVFINGEAYIDTKSVKLDGGYLALGYEIDNENWGASLDVSKYFFKTASNLIRSDVKLSIDGAFYYNFNWLTVNFDPSYNFGTAGSLVLAGGLTKEIDIDDVTSNSDIHITPELYLWAGNESVTINHLLVRKRKMKKPITSRDNFHLASIEFNLLSEYIINDKFTIIVNPLISFPQNYKELGGYYANNYPKEIFILTTGVAYSF